MVRRVANISIELVDDPATFRVAEVEKPAVNRAPPGKPGSWAVQSLIFDKEKFTAAQAAQWIKDAPEYENLDVEETGTSFRFRQYDPQHFSRFRIIRITDGVSGVYGEIAAKEAEDQGEAAKSVDALVTKVESAMTTTAGILRRGVRLAPVHLVTKAEPAPIEERFVLGLVLEPNDGATGPYKPDTQGDIYSAEAIREAAHNWMEQHGDVDLNHSWKALGKEKVRILESYLAPCDFDLGEGSDAYHVVKGTWLLGLRILDDAVWQDVKAGKIGAYSIGGTATRTPETPPAAEG
jgi:hypothetical protein